MVELKSFKGLHYNPEKVGNLENVVTPPHDVISEGGQNRYYERSPYNVIRLILGKHQDGDAAGNNCYTRARDFLRKWTDEGILVQDDEDAIYVYQQTYTVNDRRKNHTGMIALVKLEDFEDGNIMPHERINPDSMDDRYRLMKECNANMSLIISLYPDRAMKTNGIFDSVTREEPRMSVTDGDGIVHTVWAIRGRRAISGLAKELRDKKLYIADGHHRYTTALKHSKETDNPDAKYMMMFLLNLYDDLTVLPCHRVVRGIKDFSPGRLAEYFKIEEREMVPDKSNERHTFGMYCGGKHYTLRLKDPACIGELVNSDKSATWRELDVTVLHSIIIGKLLGLGDNALDSIKFTKDVEKAVRLVDDGRYQVAFFLNPTKLEDVREVADHGERMPQKSTYFYPKPLSGLIIRKF